METDALSERPDDGATDPGVDADTADSPVDAEAADPGELATRVVVSYPEDLSRWGRIQVETPSFRAFLRKTRDRAREGDVWEEFVGVGCCGNALDVPLRIERVEGGSRLGPDTEIAYAVGEACGIEGSWRVQSAGGPRRA